MNLILNNCFKQIYNIKMSQRQKLMVQGKRKKQKLDDEKNKKLEHIENLTDEEKTKLYTEVKKGKETDLFEKDIIEANRLWDDLKKKTEDPEFIKLDDNKKVELYQNSDFKLFYTTYPIVCRYMICMGQFTTKAFRRFLTRSYKLSKLPPNREPGYVEDQWIRRQSDYVMFLWESMQVHFDKKDSKKIWDHSYETLKKEFADFRKLHDEISTKLKSEEKSNKSELINELLERLKLNNTVANVDETKELLVNKLNTINKN